MTHAHPASADDRARENFAGRGKSGAAQNMSRNDREGHQGGDGSLEEATAGELVALVHAFELAEGRGNAQWKRPAYRSLVQARANQLKQGVNETR